MKTHSLNSLVGGFLALIAAVALTSCGGGGASGSVGVGGTVSITPPESTVYAGVPVTFQILGGRFPYTVTSSEATILPVPSQVNSHSFTVVPNNPGVVDTGLGPNDLPIRTMTITVQGNDGSSDSAVVHVAQNFLTGYGVTFSPSACPSAPPAPATPATGNVACSGGDTAVVFAAVTGATLHGNEAFNLSIISGDATLIDPSTGASARVNLPVVSDHAGIVHAIIHVNAGTPTELGVLRIQEASTGVYTDHVFVIQGNANSTTLTAIPSQFSFTGATSAQCGTGTGTFEVFDGAPPYSAVSSNTGFVSVSPATSNKQPGVFTVSAGDPNTCGNASIIVTDSAGAHVEVKVTTAAGSGAPPVVPTPLVVSPNTITIDCAQSASASIAGGASTTYTASSPNPDITATILGNTITVTRGGTLPDLDATPKNTNVTITDGTSFITLKVTAPTTCSP